MDSWHIIRHVHHIGSPISGIVKAHDELTSGSYGVPNGNLVVETEFPYRGILPYEHLVDEMPHFSADLIPNVGDTIKAVVFNFNDDTLYLSAKPSDLKVTTIEKWQEYYDYIDTLTVGSTITGIVEKVEPYGIFVNIGSPFIGLIDIGHFQFNGGVRLPRNQTGWPKEGDKIQCNVGYFRLHNQQIGLGWLPENSV